MLKSIANMRPFSPFQMLLAGLGSAAILSLIATYSAIGQYGLAPAPERTGVWWLIVINAVLLLALAFTIIFRVMRLLIARKAKGHTGSTLQTRIIVLFSLITVIPTLIVAAFSVAFFKFGIQSWFDEKVGTALKESVAVAQSYLAEHKENIRGDVLAMANDLNRDAAPFTTDSRRLSEMVETQAAIRELPEAVVFQRGRVIAQSALSFSLALDVDNVPLEALKSAQSGEVVILTSEGDERVRALVKLDNFFDTYLLVGRYVDSKILNHTELTKGSVREYNELRSNISKVQTRFAAAFSAASLLLLFFAIGVGLLFAEALVKPIGRLVEATGQLKGGDLSARVPEGSEYDELDTLARAFNQMAGQLERQRAELVEVNRQIDTRRRFIEAVLTGISAGVVALGADKTVHLFNRSALTLLSAESETLKNKHFLSIFPEVQSLLEEAEKRPGKPVQGEIKILRRNPDRDQVSRQLTLLVRVMAQSQSQAASEIEGFIVTFDDVTEIQAAHKSAVWADVARRIAHEIKNPLTPIHLAAERLRKKYHKEVQSDPETFLRYTDTIIRHAGDIGRMVEEFVTFARMPLPQFVACNLAELIRESVFSRQCASPNVRFVVDLPSGDTPIEADPGQIVQVLTNLLKNAEEAIEAAGTAGVITIALNEKPGEYELEIKDNGGGFPEALLGRLTEPYVTTRAKGTGLGLAIAKRIAEDHGGAMSLENTKPLEPDEAAEAPTEARILLRLPRSGSTTAKKPMDIPSRLA